MTQTQERPILLIPAKRRELPAVPVLIRVPMMAGVARGPLRRTRRRRLRREVRIAAFAFLTAVPASFGFFLAGGERPGTLAIAATRLEVSAESEDFAMPSLPIRLEPIVTLSAPSREIDVPVILPGYLLPADVTEETSNGGH